MTASCPEHRRAMTMDRSSAYHARSHCSPNKPSRAAAKRQPFENPMALQTQLVLLLGRAELAASLNACQGFLEELHRLALFLGRHAARVKFEPEMW
jgi:hypothetical protein